MKLQLESPFHQLWKIGYLRESKLDGRKRVDLFNSNEDRTTISYARYLMSVKAGKIISPEYEVDHIDEDHTNDEITNLQILTVEEHLEKSNKKIKTGRKIVTLICPNCNEAFEKEVRFIKPDTLPKCSQRCNALYNRKSGKWLGKTKP